MRWTVPKASLLPAGILAVVVGFTFATLRSYGPESTVRKLHATLNQLYKTQMQGKGIPRRDWEQIRSLIVEDAGVPFQQQGDPRALAVVSFVVDAYRQNATYRLARTDRYPNEVRIAVLYRYPNAIEIPVIWVVLRDPVTKEWRISATKTALA
jgi:hypothetical protein